jgi:O-antigen/teichoic acid export membrane protein
MRLGHNVLVGLASSAWSAGLNLLVVPIYLKFLGLEAYGIIGFFVTMQALLGLLDLGLAPTINREVARGVASGDLAHARNLLHTLSIAYCCMAAGIAVAFYFLAPVIATYWLNSNSLPPDTISHALALMGFVIACRWPIGLYMGALMGKQRLAYSSTISMIMTTAGTLGAVATLAFVSPTIAAFFIWQAAVGLLYVAVIRAAAWRAVGRTGTIQFDIVGLKNIWRFSAGMTGVAISGVALTQLDKVVLSQILNLADFGRYALAGTLASGLYIFLTPVFNAIYPRMSMLVATGETQSLVDMYRNGTRLLLGLLFPAALAAIIFSEDFISLWTGNPNLATSVAPIVSLLLIGTSFNGAMHFPYALQLAYGLTRIPLLINAILLVTIVPVTIVFASRYGAIGGAGAWAFSNTIYLFLGTWLTHREVLKDIGMKWLLWDVGIPFFLSLVVVGLAGSEVHRLGWPLPAEILTVAGLVFIVFYLTASTSRRTFQLLKNIFLGFETKPSG